MLASLYNGNVHVWNHETQVSVSVGTGEGEGEVIRMSIRLCADSGQVLRSDRCACPHCSLCCSQELGCSRIGEQLGSVLHFVGVSSLSHLRRTTCMCVCSTTTPLRR